MLFSRSMAGLVAGLCATFALADTREQDLGTVLANNKNLTTFYSLIKKFPDVLLQLPNYEGITTPPLKTSPTQPSTGIWDPEDKEATVPLLQYHILKGTVATGALKEGPTYVESTLLTDPKYTNVTTGQNVAINKQPPDVVVFTTSMGTRCTLVEADIPFRGGLVQVVDNLLIPPARLGNTTEAFQVVDFLGAMYAAELMPDVAVRENVTIFAPSDEALNRVGGTLQDMDVDELARVMKYHVIPDQVLVSSSIKNGTYMKTLAQDASGKDQSVLFRQAGNNLYMNSAQIIQPNILIANGILHIISNVLNPDAAAASPNPTIGTQAPVFPVSEVDDAFTSALPCTTDCPVTTTAGGANATAATAATTTTDLFTSESDGAAAPARCTAHIAGAAMGVLGVGAGMIWL